MADFKHKGRRGDTFGAPPSDGKNGELRGETVAKETPSVAEDQGRFTFPIKPEISWRKKWSRATNVMKFIDANEQEIKKSLKERGRTFELEEMKNLWKKICNLMAHPADKKDIKDQIRNDVERLWKFVKTCPNIIAKDVPPGADESQSPVIRKWGKPKRFAFKPSDHIEIGKRLNIIDLEKGAGVAGSGFYFLKNEAAILEVALINLVKKMLLEKGFVFIIPPELVTEEIIDAAGFTPAEEQTVYKVQARKGRDLYLIATAEIPILGIHKDEVLAEDQLPELYLGFSSCFRVEAGAYGKKVKGVFRTHEFDKLEMFVFCKPEESKNFQEQLLDYEEEILQALEIPYRLVNVCSGDLGAPAYKKFDLEAWIPSQRRYREVTSCSNCLDWQAMRLSIRYKEESTGQSRFIHTVNATAVAIGRTLIAILENHQQKDGSVLVPKVLQKYTGFGKILPKT